MKKLTFKEYLTEETDRLLQERYLTTQEMKSAGKLSKLADKLNVSFSELKRMGDKEVETILKNVGEHDFVPDSEFDPNELKMGIEVEKEHTKSNLIAKLITKDHLKELPRYYSKLKKMESEKS